MLPADWLVLAMAVQCAVASYLYASNGQWSHSLMFFGYVIANVGILWTSIKR